MAIITTPIPQWRVLPSRHCLRPWALGPSLGPWALGPGLAQRLGGFKNLNL